MDEKDKLNGSNTFVVQVRYRRNGEWQGTVSWMNGNKQSDFRSVLEMLKLMEETMDSEGTYFEESEDI